VVATGGKNGYMYVLNAKNGAYVPNFSIPEVKVPDPSGKGIALNTLWPTQPEPTGGAGQIVPTCYTDAQVQQYYGTLTAPNGTPLRGSCPFGGTFNDAYSVWGSSGSGGGMGYPRTAFDPQTNSLYICAQIQSIGTENRSPVDYRAQSVGTGHGAGGTVTALDMGTNKITWQVTWGATPTYLPAANTTAPNPPSSNPYGNCYSGVLTTGGGLVFTSSSPFGNVSPVPAVPGNIFAYDAKTGKVLWTWQAYDVIDAAPMTYSVNGKQYVAEVVKAPDATGKPDRLTVFSL
jgi:hypothetical protein